MKKKNYGFLLLLLVLMTTLTGCLDEDDPNIPGLVITPAKDRVFISDSFERAEIFADPNIQTLFGWRGFIWDWGIPVLGLEGNQVEAVIFDDSQMGPASEGDNALYFYGRPGHSIHNLYLIAQRYDLSVASEQNQTSFNTAILSFDYLTFMLNDQQDINDGVEEYLRVEVCSATVNECGVNEDLLDVNGLNDQSVWTVVFDSRIASPNLDAAGFDGTNHLQSDWEQAQIVIDLNDTNIIPNKANVIFRFTARMRDGFKPNGNGTLEDGAAIDNVVGLASPLTIDELF